MITVRKRRRIEAKTDYKARIEMLKGNMPRVVFRKTNRYITGQFVKSKEAQDFVSIGVESRSLLEFGWPDGAKGSLKSLPAAYLTGFLLGKRILDKEGKIKAILDIGMQRSTPKSKMYAFLKGVVDSGVEISCNEKMFPDEAKISGKNAKKEIPFKKIKEKIEKQ